MKIFGLTIEYNHRETVGDIESLRIERAAQAAFRAEIRAEEIKKRKAELQAEETRRKEAIAARLAELKAGSATDLNAGAA